MPEIAAAGQFEVSVEPGDYEIERGATLLVVAKFGDLVPPEAQLAISADSDVDPVSAQLPNATDGEDSAAESTVAELTATEGFETRPMARSLADPQFVGRVPAVNDDLQYFVAYANQRTDVYRVSVFEYPKLRRADLRLQFPEYTRLGEKRIEDVRQATAVEGTKVTITCHLNKHVASAKLVDRDGNEIALQQQPEAPTAFQTEWTLTESRRFRLHLLDDEGRANKAPPELVLNVTPNRPPEINMLRPARDVRVSPIEELAVRAELADDFGLLEYGIGYSLGVEDVSRARA